MREKSQVEDIDRSIYDIRDEEKDAYRMKEGLTPQIVEQLSKEKAYEMSRVYLKTPNVPGQWAFSRRACRTPQSSCLPSPARSCRSGDIRSSFPQWQA